MKRRLTLARTVRILLTVAVLGVCLVAIKAQSGDVAKAIEISGDVSVIRGGPVALFKDLTVRTKEVIVTGPDGYARFQIADGSTFEVFSNARVTFRDTYNWMDMIEVLLGKVRVQIEHRNGPNHKRVSTPTAVISVRGTIFDVNVEDGEGTTLVSVEEGLVGVKHRLQAGDEKLLQPGEGLRIFANSPIARAGGNQNGQKIILDGIKRAGIDVVLNNPAGGRVPGGAPGSTGGAQGDRGKKKGGTGPGGGPGGPGGAPPPGGGN